MSGRISGQSLSVGFYPLRWIPERPSNFLALQRVNIPINRRYFTTTANSSAVLRQRSIDSLDKYQSKKFDELSLRVVRKALEMCSNKMSLTEITADKSLSKLSENLKKKLQEQLGKEKDADEKPLTTVFKENQITLSDFTYDEDGFLDQILKPPYHSRLTYSNVRLLLSTFMKQKPPSLYLQNEELQLLNSSDDYWHKDIDTLAPPILIGVGEETNIEKKTFSQMAIDTIQPTGTLVRELGAGRGDCLLSLLHHFSHNPTKLPLAFYASDINPAYVLMGNLALSTLDIPLFSVSLGLGHFLGKFNYHTPIPPTDQVVLLSRVLTVCDLERIQLLLRHLNHSLKKGDRVVCSFAAPNGSRYHDFQTDKRLSSVPIGRSGAAFWQTIISPELQKAYSSQIPDFDQLINQHFRIILHSFMSYEDAKILFEKYGFEISRYTLLEESKQQQGLKNDMIIIEAKKKKDLDALTRKT